MGAIGASREKRIRSDESYVEWNSNEKSAHLYSRVRRPGTLLGCINIRSGRRPLGAARPSFAARDCFARSQADYPIEVRLMTYMKLITKGTKHHLSESYQSSSDSLTLCGCVVTRPQSWKHISTLEGDECEQCAALAFRGDAAKKSGRVSVPR